MAKATQFISRAVRFPTIASSADITYYKHIGIYTFTGAIFCSITRRCRWVRWRQAERLEQLRALENGYSIRVVETEYESWGVDTPEDLERVSYLLSGAGLAGYAGGLVPEDSNG